MVVKNINKLTNFINILVMCGTVLCCDSIGKSYISTEHPRVTFYDTKYFKYINLTSARLGRQDLMYYVGFHVDVIYPAGNNITVDFYFYQLLTNVYKRSFVEMHFGLCDLILKDNFFGTPMRQGKVLGQTCPFVPGVYHFVNMSIPVAIIPRSFPFNKGRIYANLTSTETSQLVGAGYIDMELKPCRRAKTT